MIMTFQQLLDERAEHHYSFINMCTYINKCNFVGMLSQEIDVSHIYVWSK